MKICFLLPINGISGGIFVTYTHALALQAVGHDVSVAFEVFNGKDDIKYFKNDAKLKTKSLEEACREEFDVVICTWWETYFSAMSIPAKKYMYFCQSDERKFYDEDDFLNRSFVALTYMGPNVGIITEAKWIKNFLENEFGAKVEYAPNGVDLKLFNPQILPLEKKPEGKFRILIEGPGSIGFKRVDDAFKIVNHFQDVEVWYVASDGFSRPDWKFDRMFTGVPYSKMGEIYRSCDILIKVSAVEGFFGPPLEMMACGGCCLVSNVTGYDEYIVDNKNALVIPVGDIQSGRKSLERLLNDSKLRQSLIKQGLETANGLSWDIQTPKFAAAINSLFMSIGDVTDIEKKRASLQLQMLKRLRDARSPGKPYFSVVIPIYNRTYELELSIQSILSQTFVDFELILVCDGSPPETLKIVDKYAEHPKVRVHKFSDNSGNACRGRNKGIEISNGQYVVFNDSDDISTPNRLKTTFALIQETKAEILSGRAAYIVDGTREVDGIVNGQVQVPYYEGLEQMIKGNPFVTSTVAVKKDALLKYGAFRKSMQYREDHELWARLIFNGAKVAISDEVLVQYRLHQGNAELLFKDRDAYWYERMLAVYREKFNAEEWC